MQVLRRTQFGNPILREKARHLTAKEILSPKTRRLIKDMQTTLSQLKLGVGLAAPQVGEGSALAIVAIQPTEHRPKVKLFNLVLINPVIIETIGRKKQLWEGCISSGPNKTGLFAKVPRFIKIKVKFQDETGHIHHRIFEGLRAHVIQHEVDHLNGVLFVDKVKDTSTYCTYSEYKKRIATQDA